MPVFLAFCLFQVIARRAAKTSNQRPASLKHAKVRRHVVHCCHRVVVGPMGRSVELWRDIKR